MLALGYTLATAQLSNAVLTAQTLEKNGDFFLILRSYSSRPTNNLHNPVGRAAGITGFLSHLYS
jgi:hypothetical protein